MPSRISFVVLAGAVLMPCLAPAAAAAPEILGVFKNWSAYSTGTGAGKVCYALSRPTASEPRHLRRDPTYFLINDWPDRKAKAEPEIVPGFLYKPGSSVEVQVGADKLSFFTKDEGGTGGAWVEAQADEERLVAAMKGASEAVVTSTSKRGTKVRDTYSLAGLSEALDKAHQACGM